MDGGMTLTRHPTDTSPAWRQRARVALVAVAVALLGTLPAGAEPALWRIEENGSIVYLFGTVHALKSGTDWESPKIARALADSGELWLEIADGDDPGLATEVAPLASDAAHPLSSRLSKTDLDRLDRAMTAAGLPGSSSYDSMRPWMAAVMLGLQPLLTEGYDPKLGVDETLKGEAARSGKPVRGLETSLQQMHFFADLSPAVEVEFLQSALDEVGKGPAMVHDLIGAWLQGDVARIDSLMDDDDRMKYPDLYRVLLVNRNEAWAGRIAGRIKSGGGVTFVAVGAGHLAGGDSLITALEARGIHVTRLDDGRATPD